MSPPHTSLVNGPAGALEILTAGRGDPHTVFAHGLGGSIPTTRPYAGQVPGTRTFLHFRGHGRSSSPDQGWEYAELAAELWAVADHVGATQALGISMGAGALCAGLVHDPDRFERVVLVLPAVIDRARSDAAMARLVARADLVDAGQAEALARHLLADEPAAVRDEGRARHWARAQAGRLIDSGAARALRMLPYRTPLTDREALRQVRVPVLLLAQEGDPAHPDTVARELAEVLPSATLQVLPPGGIMWEHRAHVRDLVGDFLTPTDDPPAQQRPAPAHRTAPNPGEQRAMTDHTALSPHVATPQELAEAARAQTTEPSPRAYHDRTQDVFVVERPWGQFQQFATNERVTVKTVTIAAGQRLSLQTHAERNEMWQVLDHPVQITVGERTWLAQPGELVWVPVGTLHRMGNPGEQPARILELAFGDFDEADITRVEDDYRRD